ncbi:MAG: sialate O-acetylesterase [Lachnospiraceae bacterium]|nr:sialate O-acetylesterase [Lachnospiraceae bacterium]
MHGIELTKRPADWEILQQENGSATVTLEGKFQVIKDAIDVGVASARPIIRVVREDDNFTIIPWHEAAKVQYSSAYAGTFETTVTIPEGGLYRIDTSLETKSTLPNVTWLYRGDCVLHLGVGDLFIIAGQSNSSGYSRDFCPDPPHLCVHLFRNRNQWDLATHPMNESTGADGKANAEWGTPGTSPYLSFGKVYYQETNRPVGLIQTSLGGSPMKRWNPIGGDLYANMIDQIRLTHGKYAGVLWYQGCSDTDPESSANYYENFKFLVEALRKELGYEIPFFTMQLNRQIGGINDACWGMVRDAQRRAALMLPKVYLLTTTNLALSDGIHNSAMSNLVLGERLARQALYRLCGKDAFEPPYLKQVGVLTGEEKEIEHIDGDWLKLTYGNIKNCLQMYSTLPEKSGFTLSDAQGEIRVLETKTNRSNYNHLMIKVDRLPDKEVLISYLWEADPQGIPIVDEVTFLPAVSLYQARYLIQ